ncbi:cell division protein ZapB [Vibrio lentus]|nr:cell division protein ZapB [Vibrio lentus]
MHCTSSKWKWKSLKKRKEALATEAGELLKGRHDSRAKIQQMQEEHSAWQDRIRKLLGKMDDVE